jgi:hypothetical protein
VADVAFNFSSSSFYVLHSITGCWRCERGSLVYALMLSNGSRVDVLRNVRRISREAYFLLKAEYPLYAVDFSKTQKAKVFMNHCAKCGAKLGDFFLHSHPGGPFWPINADEASELILRRFTTPIEVAGERGNGFGSLLIRNARDYSELQIKTAGAVS